MIEDTRLCNIAVGSVSAGLESPYMTTLMPQSTYSDLNSFENNRMGRENERLDRIYCAV